MRAVQSCAPAAGDRFRSFYSGPRPGIRSIPRIEQRAKKNGIESHAENAGHDVSTKRISYATHKGEPRDDAVLLNSFSDEQNDGALFTGWHDYAQVAGRLPISAQVFQVWYRVLADAEKRMNPDVDMIDAHRVFPGLVELSRKDQKRRLVRAIEKYKGDKKLHRDPKTERQPLVLNAIL
jgi:hypothetical protein